MVIFYVISIDFLRSCRSSLQPFLVMRKSKSGRQCQSVVTIVTVLNSELVNWPSEVSCNHLQYNIHVGLALEVTGKRRWKKK